MTNAERIRSMTDDELAVFLTKFKNTFGEEYEGEKSCLDWLQSEVAEMFLKAFDDSEEKIPCNCQHNGNSRDNESCRRCDSKVSENDDTKNKVTSLEIIVRMIDNNPYYEIKYKKVGEDYYHVGYSSFNIDNVLKWRDECFEIVDVKVINADRIRNMSDEELAVSIMCPAEYDLSFNKECKCNGEMNRNCCKCTLKWLQSEAE